jgi:LacI family transcriptional regulator
LGGEAVFDTAALFKAPAQILAGLGREQQNTGRRLCFFLWVLQTFANTGMRTKMSKGEKKSKTPTIIDVARESGVSYSTVSRTLSGYEHVKAGTREKVLRAAEKLGYVPNQQARSLAGGRSNLIGVLVPSLNNGYVNEIVRGVDEELAKSNYNLILYTTHRHQGKESSYVATIMNGAADGLLLVVPLISTSYLNALRQQSFPYVLIDQADEMEQSPVVTATNRQGAYEATKYLIGLGHHRIGFVSGLAGLNSAAERLDGYLTALSDHGIPPCPQLVVEGGFLESGGFKAAQRMMALPDMPTAIFASNDLSAFGVMEAIRQNGLRVPDDISVIGFDDIPQASIGYPKLTTVHQPLEQLGREAVTMLLDFLENPTQDNRRVVLPTQLTIRDSCAAPRSEVVGVVSEGQDCT